MRCGRHYSDTVSIVVPLTKTSTKLLVGKYSSCARQKAMTVKDFTIENEGQRHLLENFVRAGQMSAKNLMKKTRRTLETGMKIASETLSESLKQL